IRTGKVAHPPIPNEPIGPIEVPEINEPNVPAATGPQNEPSPLTAPGNPNEPNLVSPNEASESSRPVDDLPNEPNERVRDEEPDDEEHTREVTGRVETKAPELSIDDMPAQGPHADSPTRVVRVSAESLTRLMGLAGESLVQARQLRPL